jgi:hypothetical protein
MMMVPLSVLSHYIKIVVILCQTIFLEVIALINDISQILERVSSIQSYIENNFYITFQMVFYHLFSRICLKVFLKLGLTTG